MIDSEQSRQYFETRLTGQRFNGKAEQTLRCPFHEDRHASLSVNRDQGVWNCQAGCGGGGILDFEERFSHCDRDTARKNVNELLGAVVFGSNGKKPIAVYTYTDARGKLIFEKYRYHPKDFRLCRKDDAGRRIWNLDGIEEKPLYRLPELLISKDAVIVEGEKDADNLTDALKKLDLKGGRVAVTTNFEGAGPGKWSRSYSPYFAGKDVVILPDNDDAGRARGEEIAASIYPYAAGIKVVMLSDLPEKGDVSNYLESHTVQDLIAEVKKQKRAWSPPLASAAKQTTPATVASEHPRERKKSATHKVANWQTCAEVKPENLVFLWPQRVPLKFGTAFLGDPDMGKSLMSLDLMARLSRGKPFLDGAENPHGVVESILLSTEDDANAIIVPRLMVAGADLSKIHLVDTVRLFDGEEALEEERQLTLESDLAVIREKIASNPAIKLLVIDPLSNYLGSRNLMKEQEVRSVLMPVVTMAQELSIAVIVIMHHSKTEGRSAMHKAIGAVGCLRMAWSFVKSQDDETIREMLQSKKNLGRFPGLRFTTESANVTIDHSNTEQALIKYLDVSNASIETVLAAQEDKEGRQDQRAAGFLKQNLPKDGTHHSEDIIQKAKEERISPTALFRARKNLGINTEKIANQWFWSWPPEGEA